jgi:hypothetical protein
VLVRVFVSDRPFQSIGMFASSTRGKYLKGAPEMLHYVRLRPYSQTLDLAGKLYHGQALQLICYEGKSFITLARQVNLLASKEILLSVSKWSNLQKESANLLQKFSCNSLQEPSYKDILE